MLLHTGRTGGVPVHGASTIVLSESALALTIASGATTEYPAAAITVTNGTLNPTASLRAVSNDAWLTIASTYDDAGDLVLTPTVNASALSLGAHSGTITVTDVRASNSPQTVTVDVTVVSAVSTIGLTPSSVAVTLTDETVGAVHTVLISSVGTLPLATPTVGTITYGSGATGWVTNAAITSNGDGSFTLSFTPTAVGGTAGGPYTATIPIVSTGASNTPQNVTVSLTVTAAAAAVLVLDRNLDDMSGAAGGANPAAQTVGIRSGNATPLAGPVVSAPVYGGSFTGWATGSLSGNTLTVTPNITGLVTGTGWVDYTITDSAAGNSAVYRVLLKLSVATVPAALRASPTGVGASATVGSSPLATVVTISNAGSGGLAALGVVTPAFTSSITWCTPTYDSATGALTLTFTASALPEATYSATLRVSSSYATVAYIDVPVVLTMTAVVAPGTWPSPPSDYIFPTGLTWNSSLGYPEGSVFNTTGPAGCANLARPTFSGTTHQIPETYATWGAASAAITAGTIVPGDIISIRADQVITDAQIPVIPGRVLTDQLICVQSRNMANLPAYSYASGPASFGVNNRGGKAAHLAYMPIFKTTTLNQSVLSFQQGGGGYWFEGVQLWADTSTPTQVIVDFGARIGYSASNAQTQLSHIPSGIVIDRFYAFSTNGHQNTFVGNARYLRITHGTAQYARRPGTANDNYENKFIYFTNTDGKIEILGNEYSALGIGSLVGGADPTIAHINPSDGVIMWNRYPNQAIANNGLDGDDDKNFHEHKTGRRWFVAFNVATDICGRQDQKYAFLSKSVDTNGGNNFIAHSTDQMFWCNKIHGAKGLAALVPRTVASTSALDSERLYAMYNLVVGVWDQDHYPGLWKRNSAGSPLWGFTSGDRIPTAIYKSQGLGIQTAVIDHNTFGTFRVQPGDVLEDYVFLELTSSSAGVWSNVRVDNNVCYSRIKYGPCRGDQTSNTAGMNIRFGAGNWNMRRNLVTAGGVSWDATMSGAGYNNGYLQSGGLGANFVNPVESGGDFSLVTGHPAKGTATDNTDPGYNHAYLTAMTSTVLSNAGN